MEKFLILLGIDRGGRNYLVSERKKNKGNNKGKGISFWLLIDWKIILESLKNRDPEYCCWRVRILVSI